MPKVFFPNQYMSLLSIKYIGHKIRPPQATFRVEPSMNKFEIKEYLTKIYGLKVQKIMTQNFLGRRKRLMGKRLVVGYARPDFKKAIVTFERGSNVYDPPPDEDIA
ncbi:hypothetical protein CTAYLR_002760 [Chrysophaeum taylorii]|uniref:Large ribosomal subunit protein uL23m n=1 Tax=Chrysophaeum taylorii TaxID=2483200 RepID=A0AAD7UE25_9STRA|nr:hypothetical protein CTAYLR_002760 [Chrysophaeum taylorii]